MVHKLQTEKVRNLDIAMGIMYNTEIAKAERGA